MHYMIAGFKESAMAHMWDMMSSKIEAWMHEYMSISQLLDCHLLVLDEAGFIRELVAAMRCPDVHWELLRNHCLLSLFKTRYQTAAQELLKQLSVDNMLQAFHAAKHSLSQHAGQQCSETI